MKNSFVEVRRKRVFVRMPVAEFEQPISFDSLAPLPDVNITLKRQLKIECWRIIGQIATAKKRPELMAVLMRAKENGFTDAADIAQHLLFEARSRRVVAERLLGIAAALKLMEEHEGTRGRFILTTDGEHALESEQVFVPEEGTWSVWVSKDPLLKSPILHVEPWKEPTAFEENKQVDSIERDFQDLPEWFLKVKGAVTRPIASGGEWLRVDAMDKKGEKVIDKSMLLNAVWDCNNSDLSIEGSFNQKSINTKCTPPDVSLGLIWKDLLDKKNLWSSWDQNHSSMRVGFNDVSEAEVESMCRDIEFELPKISDYGSFNTLMVERVKLKARSEADAQDWAMKRLASRVQDYAVEERYSHWSEESAKPFMDEFNPILPDRRELAVNAWGDLDDRPAPYAWYLIAAEDWSLL